ncbi:DUF2927 domain-containing protein [Cohaesibacter celericrescens]|uniref:DUF2927 domain-containing protein n=1 Tax=Cohaesibacter celericrescens TaxID=2067669 RepID=A0A2N5XKG3_9HYPH|nr:DUF2927 domain-containing protein [Cohaesibacter celericrescens]PLW75006.1 hypothetical protein C0081_22150 [Cohaesibacter celericrescens]
MTRVVQPLWKALGSSFSALFVAFFVLASSCLAQAATYRDADVAEGFYKTVFGAEIKALSWGSQTNRVKKYVTPVKVWIDNRARLNRLKTVRQFVSDLPRFIPGLEIRMARNSKDANFRIYIVDAEDYATTVQTEVFNNQKMRVPGQCIVRVLSRRSGIMRSDAVIVSDQGLSLFRRCMVEEILQGLGPVNDNESLTFSVFNDLTTYDHFTKYDRMILNMLYNPSVKPGMTLRQVKPLTPDLLQYARQIIGEK